MAYAQVLVFQPIRSKATPLFDYAIPAALAEAARPGVLVVVPFQERLLPGVIVALAEVPSVPAPRPLHSLLDPEPALSPALLALAEWMARETLAPLHECVQLMIPPGLRAHADQRLRPLVAAVPAGLSAEAAALLQLLVDRGPLLGRQVAAALRGQNWRSARHALRQRGLIATEHVLQLPDPRAQTVKQVQLAAPRGQWETALKRARLKAQYQTVLEYLDREAQPVDVTVVYAETGADAAQLQALARRNLIAFSRAELPRDPLADFIFTPDLPPPLTPDQQAAWEQLAAWLPATPAPRAPAPVLLLGVTGSGKTELYLRAIEHVLAQGRQALFLVPEISLTPQTVQRVAVRFPGRVGLWHSGMSEGARYDTWRRVRSGELAVLVGARSALFVPFPRLGVIVLDEEEDSSYKQGSRPFYHARETAETLARLTGALLILGSATPTLEAYTHAQEGRYRLLSLPRRVLGHRRRLADWQRFLRLPASRYRPLIEAPEAAAIALPPVQVVDMRAELKAGNRSVFSRPLQTAVDEALSRGEQGILFLNRRGTATYVFCRDCGWVALCPRCELPLTYHAGGEVLLCHHCGHRRKLPVRCPQCRSERVRAFGLGTEGLEQQTAARWSQARLLRWDRDTARSHAGHATLMTSFAEGGADLLVGTQMIARGLDLPRVTVVGIVSADVGLNLPDFRAAERTFQLLAQVAGRAGRGLAGGRVILQTYQPEHYVIQAAAVHDYAGFAARELAYRRELGYPPAIRLARLVFTHPDAHHAQAQAEQLAARLRALLAAQDLPVGDLIGPAPAFFARVRGHYRWQLLLRSVDPAALLRTVELPAGWVVDIDPVEVL